MYHCSTLIHVVPKLVVYYKSITNQIQQSLTFKNWMCIDVCTYGNVLVLVIYYVIDLSEHTKTTAKYFRGFEGELVR